MNFITGPEQDMLTNIKEKDFSSTERMLPFEKKPFTYNLI
jgi:hypothetical protein